MTNLRDTEDGINEAGWEKAMQTPVMTALNVRWRLNDPGQENRVRWSLVHTRTGTGNDLMLCGRTMPEFPYDQDNGPDQLPNVVNVCKRCQAKGAR